MHMSSMQYACRILYSRSFMSRKVVRLPSSSVTLQTFHRLGGEVIYDGFDVAA